MKFDDEEKAAEEWAKKISAIFSMGIGYFVFTFILFWIQFGICWAFFPKFLHFHFVNVLLYIPLFIANGFWIAHFLAQKNHLFKELIQDDKDENV